MPVLWDEGQTSRALLDSGTINPARRWPRSEGLRSEETTSMMLTIGSFTVTARPDGAAVQFSVAESLLLPRFKQSFPRARFRAATRSWHVPGVLAVSRVTRFAEAVAQEQHKAQARIERILRDAEFDGHPVSLDIPGLEGRAYLAALAHNGRKLSTRHILARARDGHVRVGFAYNEEAWLSSARSRALASCRISGPGPCPSPASGPCTAWSTGWRHSSRGRPRPRRRAGPAGS
jgi:hypothetical protein